MKKILSVMLALCMAFGLAACGAAPAAELPAGKPSPLPSGQGGQTGGGSGPAQAFTASFFLSGPSVKEGAQYPSEEDHQNKDGSFDWESYSKAQDLWYKEQNARAEAGAAVREKLYPYFENIIPALCEGCTEKNFAASPSNIFIALAMLAEITDGQSRQQILDAIGMPDIEAARECAAALWQANYIDDGIIKSLPSASVWVNSNARIKQEILSTLAQYYYASVWQGDPKDQGFCNAFKVWLDEQTGGLLKDQIDSLDSFDEDMILTLATTIYFKAPWADEFLKSLTETGIFHAEDGDAETDFMQGGFTGSVYFGDGFAAIRKSFTNCGAMWFILPDEGTSAGSLLTDGAVTDFFEKEKIGQRYKVVFKVPRFDVTATIDLGPVMNALGISDVFDPQVSDFSPLTADDAFVSEATHSARVKIDEEGVEAAAFTVIMASATAMMEEPPVYEFICDRPFIFAIEGQDGLPLFIGTVEDVR